MPIVPDLSGNNPGNPDINGWDGIDPHIVPHPVTRHVGFGRTNSDGADGMFYADEFGVLGDPDYLTDAANIQNMLDEIDDLGGGTIFFNPNKRYYLDNELLINPTRHTIFFNSCTFDFAPRVMTSFASQPELVTNGDFTSNLTGWINGVGDAESFYWNAGVLKHNNSGVYGEIGQQLPGIGGKRYRITYRFNLIEEITVGPNTFRYCGISFRSAGVGNGSSGGTYFQVNSTDYSPGVTVTRDVDIPVGQTWLTIQTNNGVELESISVKELPNNRGITIRTPPRGDLRGHNWRELRDLNVVGPSNGGSSNFDAVTFNTDTAGWSSRVNIYNWNVNGNISRGFIFENRAYLMNFFGCRVVCSTACVDVLSGALDAGENISFFGGNMGGGACGIRNRGMTINLHGTSIDFTNQFYKGTGDLNAVNAWFENGATVVNVPSIEVNSGTAIFENCLFQNDGATTGHTAAAPFFVGSGGQIIGRNNRMYNQKGTTNSLCTGAGRFDWQYSQGGTNKELEGIAKRDVDHNILGNAGGFEGTTIEVPCWVQSVGVGGAHIQIDRQNAMFATTSVATTATYSIGNYAIGVASAVGLSVGNWLSAPGFSSGAKILNISGTTITMDRRATATLVAGNVTFYTNNVSASLGVRTSTLQARTGSRSLEIYKDGTGPCPFILSLAFPIQPHRPIGSELYFMVPSGGSGTTDIYFTSQFSAITDVPGTVLPVENSYNIPITDQPFQNIDLVAGMTWTRMAYSTNRVDLSTVHNGFSPMWATHVVTKLNLAQVPNGFRMYIDDFFGNML